MDRFKDLDDVSEEACSNILCNNSLPPQTGIAFRTSKAFFRTLNLDTLENLPTKNCTETTFDLMHSYIKPDALITRQFHTANVPRQFPFANIKRTQGRQGREKILC